MKRILNSNYYIDEKGSVFNSKGKEIKLNTDNGGISARIDIGNGRRSYAIWKLMQITYFPNIEKDEVFNIKDNNILNTQIDNYEILKLNEIGKQIEGYEDYLISKEGKVYSTKYERLQRMNTYISNSGYEEIKLCKNNKTKRFSIHRLVAGAFIPNEHNKEEVDHIDRNKTNNNYENLRWVTRIENMEHCFEKSSPIRNFKKCILTNDKDFYKEFKSKSECCRYAEENLGLKYHSLMKYEHCNGYRIEKPSTTIERVS